MLCRNFLVVFLLSVSMAALAVPPTFVFRVDSRPPDGARGIFATGFAAWGNNQDLSAHEQGTSCNTGDEMPSATADSAYVSVSSAQHRALRFAAAAFADTRQNIWVYTIRATSNFYNALATTENAMRSTNQRIRNTAAYVHMNAAPNMVEDGEYVSFGNIPSTLIREAARYQWRNGRYEAVAESSIRNEHYENAATHANANPIDPEIAFPRTIRSVQRNRAVTVGMSVFGACLCMSRPNASLAATFLASDGKEITDYNSYCRPMLRDENAASMLNLHLLY